MVWSRVLEGISRYDAELVGPSPLDPRLVNLKQRKIGTRRLLDVSASKLLRVSWQTELTARLGQQFDLPGLRQATLQTLPVQAYYAVFNSARAFSVVSGENQDRHSQIHTAFATQHLGWTAGAWSVSLTGDPENLNSCTLHPQICTPVSYNPITTIGSHAESVWAALRMTRRWKLRRAREVWLETSKVRTKRGKKFKKLPTGKAKELAADERATTLMDFMYELRCSTNYRSIDEFAIEVSDSEINRFHLGLVELMNTALLLYEAQLSRLVGIDALESELRKWIGDSKQIGAWASEAPNLRFAAIRSAS